jgi:hypothetical protein
MSLPEARRNGCGFAATHLAIADYDGAVNLADVMPLQAAKFL